MNHLIVLAQFMYVMVVLLPLKLNYKKGEIFEEFQNENKKGFKNETLPNKLIDKIK